MQIVARLLPLGFAISACNMAVSDHPILSHMAQSTIRLKDGLWMHDDPNCKVDATSPVHRWPKCAEWVVIRENSVVDVSGRDHRIRLVKLSIADGQPLIIEVPLGDDPKHPDVYAYLALEPKGSDGSGAILDLSLWPIACGTEESDAAKSVEIKHFPGMDEHCRPDSAKSLRLAATSDPRDDSLRARWVWLRAKAN